MEHKIKNPENTLDFDACNGLTPQGVCEGAGCYWWVNKSKCLPYITYSDSDLSGTVGTNDFIYWKWESGSKCPTEPGIPGFYGAPVPKTGQTQSYDATRDGEDGDLQMGVEWPNPRFTITYCNTSGECDPPDEECEGSPDLSNDIVADNLTGLVWARDAYLTQDDLTWQGALDYVDGMNDGGGLCGHTDWRLPNRFELESLLHLGYYNLALPNIAGTGNCTNNGDPFINVQSGDYWSATTHARYTGSAWVVSFDYGYVYYSSKSSDFYVWPVRGGQ